MNQREIMEALLSGKKLCCEDWGIGAYVYLSCGKLVDENEDYCTLDLNENAGFKIYEEPKKQVEKFLWNMKDDVGVWFLLTNYMTEEEIEEGVRLNFTWCKEYRKTNFSIIVDED